MITNRSTDAGAGPRKLTRAQITQTVLDRRAWYLSWMRRGLALIPISSVEAPADDWVTDLWVGTKTIPSRDEQAGHIHVWCSADDNTDRYGSAWSVTVDLPTCCALPRRSRQINLALDEPSRLIHTSRDQAHSQDQSRVHLRDRDEGGWIRGGTGRHLIHQAVHQIACAWARHQAHLAQPPVPADDEDLDLLPPRTSHGTTPTIRITDAATCAAYNPDSGGML